MNALAIAGFSGGSIITQGFSGLIGAPVPPVVTLSSASMEVGAGTITNIRVAEGQVIIGPWQTVDRQQMELKVHVRGTLDFNLNYEFSTDNGSLWYIGQQISAVAKSVDDGSNYPLEAHGHFNVGYWWRVSIFNMNASTPLDIAFEWRFHEF